MIAPRAVVMLWIALWMAFVLAVLAQMPGAPPYLKTMSEQILSRLGDLQSVGNPSTPSGGPSHGRGAVSVGTLSSAGSPGSGFPSSTIAPGAICIPATQFVTLMSGETQGCFNQSQPPCSGRDYSPTTAPIEAAPPSGTIIDGTIPWDPLAGSTEGNTPSQISGVAQWVSRGDFLVSSASESATGELATAQSIYQADPGTLPDGVWDDAKDLVDSGDGGAIGTLVAVGPAAAVVGFAFLAADACEGLKTAGLNGAIGAVAAYDTQETISVVASDEEVCALLVETGLGAIVCGVVVGLVALGTSLVVQDCIANGCHGVASAVAALSGDESASVLLPQRSCTFPCSGYVANGVYSSMYPSSISAPNCYLIDQGGCEVSEQNGVSSGTLSYKWLTGS